MAERGAAGWEWKDVLPYFRKLERDLDFDNALHGSSGPIPIRRVPESEWPDFSLRAARALERAGLTRLDDQNAGFEPGYFPITINNERDRRVSTAAGSTTQALTQTRTAVDELSRMASDLLTTVGRFTY